MADDGSFGPLLSYDNGIYDFTPLFEDGILLLAPLSLACIALTIHIWISWPSRSVRKVHVFGDVRFHAKTILYCALFGLQLCALVIPLTSARQGIAQVSRLFIAANTVALCCSVLLWAAGIISHIFSLRASSLCQGVLVWWMLANVAIIRSYWLRNDHTLVAVVWVLSAVILALLVLEETDKRADLLPEFRDTSRETLSGPLSRISLFWINPLMLRGIWGASLRLPDLWPVEHELSAEALSAKASRIRLSLQHAGGRPALGLQLLRHLGGFVLLPVPTRLVQTALQFTQPFMIQRTLDWYGSPPDSRSKAIGGGLIGAFAVVYVGLALSTGFAQYQTARLMTAFRGVLVILVYDGVLEGRLGDSSTFNPVTLMSSDIDQITRGLMYLHETWISLCALGIGLWLLQRELGVGAVAPVAMTFASTAVVFVFGSNYSQAQKRWLEAIETRVNATTRIVTSIKSVKMLGLIQNMTGKMNRLREVELSVSLTLRRFMTLAVTMSFATRCLAPVLGFGTYVVIAKRHDETLLYAQAFSVLAYLNLINAPLHTVLQTIPMLISSYANVERVEKFLVRAIKPPHAVADIISTGSSTASEKEELREKGSTAALIRTKPRARLSCDRAIDLTCYSVGRRADGVVTIRDMNMSALKGSFTLITGPSGCGKTTLLKGILLETPCLDGSMQYDFQGETAYCAQQAWLQSCSVKENILNGLVLDEAWLSRVVFACNLEEDIERLNDQPAAGHGGSSLSGGQRQKIAVARAVYSRLPAVFIDEPFTGMDNSSREKISRRLFGPEGLWAQIRPRPTIIVTSNSPYLGKYADHNILMGGSGNIIQQGNFEDVSALYNNIQGMSTAAERTKDEAPPMMTSIEYQLATRDETITGGIGNAEHRRTGDLAAYRYYFASLGRLKLCLAIIGVVAFVVFTLVPQLWLRWWTASNLEHPNARLGYWIGCYAAFGIIALASLTLATTLMFCDMVTRSACVLHEILTQVVRRAPWSFLSSVHPGITVNRFSQDMSLIDQDLPMNFANTVITLISSIGQMLFIAVSGKYLGAAVPFMLLVGAGVQQLYTRCSRQLRFLELEAKSPLYTRFIESVEGIATIRAFGRSETMARGLATDLDASQKPYYLLMCAQSYLVLVLNLMVAAIAILLIGICAATQGRTSLAYLGVALVNLMTFGQTLTDFVMVWCGLEISLAAVERVKHCSENTPSEACHGSSMALVCPEWPQHGGITFEAVNMSYSETGRGLKSIDLTISPGEKIVICGRSGSGKTSLCLSLLRIFELSSGSITIDGQNIASLCPEALRSKCATVTQDPFILPGTFRENLDPAENFTDGDILQILAQLGAHWATKECKGSELEQELDPNSLSFSQQQLICLARALLKRSRVLILDEATSGVDAATECAMHHVICDDFPDTTVILVTHKLKHIAMYDRVVVLVDGRITEVGPPTALLNDPASLLYHYCSLDKDESESEELKKIL